jgi:glucuronate isomerase
MVFMDERFLLHSDLAAELYDAASELPIYDFHCHLSPEEIYQDREFKNLYEIWLKGDHYKWRLMRFHGIPEDGITGNASDYDKYLNYVKTLERAIDNPLYHWSHLELRRCFGVTETICTANAEIIWEKANAFIKSTGYSPKKAMKAFKVHTVVTTDEIFSDLKYHKLIQEDKTFGTRVLPAYRADKVVNLDKVAIEKLGVVTGGPIGTLKDLESRIRKQLEHFATMGAVLADMAFEGFEYELAGDDEAAEIFTKFLQGKFLNESERRKYGTYITLFLLREYYSRGWAVLLHIGAKRNNNTNIFNSLGADTGADSVSGLNYLTGVNKLLDRLNSEGVLGNTLMFNLNPADNYKVVTTLGNFASSKARMQAGIAWWFVDNKHGIRRFLEDYASLSHLGDFLGMLTDSRSFVSYPRHEYFRRILADYIAELALKGEIPDDKDYLEGIIGDISYFNAVKFFDKTEG